MPPESMPPESNASTDRNAADDRPSLIATARQVTQSSPDRHKYDELIAVVIALFGIGAVLFWVLGRSNPLNSNGVLGGLWGNRSEQARTPAAAPLPTGASTTAASTTAKDAAPTGATTPASDQPSGKTAAPTQPQQTQSVNPAAAGAVAGAAAGNTAQAPTAGTAAPIAAAPPTNTPVATAPATVKPEIVEPDVLPSATKAQRFSDVPADSPIAPYVDALSSRGLLDQFNDGTLNPDEQITRGEFADLVSKTFGKPRTKPAIAFKDIAADSQRKAAVEEATRTGFMSGFTDGTFKPEQKIPRYQMQVAIVTGTQIAPTGDPVQSLSKFSDGQAVPKWATAKVGTAVGTGIIPAKGLQSLNPEQAATRGEAIFMLHEALVKEGKLPAVK
ncbi:MAG: hypothetical protein RLZZ511_4361 [Cyanobacteriota bacterium]|jgi:hypothetical protein